MNRKGREDKKIRKTEGWFREGRAETGTAHFIKIPTTDPAWKGQVNHQYFNIRNMMMNVFKVISWFRNLANSARLLFTTPLSFAPVLP